MTARDYTLRRLDQWYYERFERGYTADAAAQLQDRLRQRSLSKPEHLEYVVCGGLELFSRDAQLRSAKDIFTRAYNGLEESVNQGMGLPESLRQIYSTINSFVEAVREASRDSFPDELADRSIDEAFADTFEDHAGFSAFCCGALDAGEAFLDEEELVGYIDFIKEGMPYLCESVFGDIKPQSF